MYYIYIINWSRFAVQNRNQVEKQITRRYDFYNIFMAKTVNKKKRMLNIMLNNDASYSRSICKRDKRSWSIKKIYIYVYIYVYTIYVQSRLYNYMYNLFISWRNKSMLFSLCKDYVFIADIKQPFYVQYVRYNNLRSIYKIYAQFNKKCTIFCTVKIIAYS